MLSLPVPADDNHIKEIKKLGGWLFLSTCLSLCPSLPSALPFFPFPPSPIIFLPPPSFSFSFFPYFLHLPPQNQIIAAWDATKNSHKAPLVRMKATKSLILRHVGKPKAYLNPDNAFRPGRFGNIFPSSLECWDFVSQIPRLNFCLNK